MQSGPVERVGWWSGDRIEASADQPSRLTSRKRYRGRTSSLRDASRARRWNFRAAISRGPLAGL